MIPFRIAALVAACFTVTLNAHHGFKSSTVLEYAVLFAILNGALDVAKCSCLVGMRRSAQNGRFGSSLLLFLMFWPLFANSLWCGLSEITIARTSTQNQFQHAQGKRARLKAQFEDFTSERNTLQSHQMYTWSSACVRPRNRSQRRFCKQLKSVKTELGELRTQLDTAAPPDPTPHVTLVQSLTGYSHSKILFALALWPILLAELVGSLGFYLTGTTSLHRVGWFVGLRGQPKVITRSGERHKPAPSHSTKQMSLNSKTNSIRWTSGPVQPTKNRAKLKF